MKIKTPSRLHFGIIDLSREFKREYGALGVTLKRGYEIRIEESESGIQIEGNERERTIIKDVYQKLKKEYDLLPGYEITIDERLPNHVGLGSTTQLTLGTSLGLLKLAQKNVTTLKMAKMLGRGRYSAIGTHGFEKGGFILEGGKAEKNEISPLTKRVTIPDDWRFLIVCPKKSKGYDEKEERPIMEELKIDKKYPEKICHNILMGILPALKEKDIKSFGEHLTEIQRLVGSSFSDYQEGIYHPDIEDIVDLMQEHTYGGGQSSWGPTAYGIVKKSDLKSIKDKILPQNDRDFRVWIGEPNNQGVSIQK